MNPMPSLLCRYGLFGIIALLQISCGETTEESNRNYGLYEALRTQDSQRIHVNLSSKDQTFHVLVATPEAVTLLKYCVLEGQQCQNWQEVEPERGHKVRIRQLFLIADLDPSKDTIRLETVGTLTAPLSRTIRFQPVNTQDQGPANSSWKAVFMASDYLHHDGQDIVAWDNGRRDLAALFQKRGLSAQNTRHLSQDPRLQRSENTGPGTKLGLQQALASLNLADNDRCLVFMTAHGSRSEFIVRGGANIRPTELDQMLTEHCGNRPTVALISACYSGIFVNEASKRPNRIIFTAASAHKTSKGCVPGIKYNLFEQCLIDTLPRVETFQEWADVIKPCIEREDRSDPVFFLGNQVKDLKIDLSLAP